MKRCHNCGEMIEDNAQTCKFCGKDLPLEDIQSVGLYMPTNAPGTSGSGGPSKEAHISLVGGMEFLKRTGWKGVLVLIIIGLSVYGYGKLARGTVVFDFLVQSANNPDVFIPQGDVNLEMSFSRGNEEPPAYRLPDNPNAWKVDPDYYKKHPPIEVSGRTDSEGKMSFLLPVGEYKWHGLKIASDSKDLLSLIPGDWDINVFVVSRGQTTRIPRVTFIQPIKMLFPQNGDSVSISAGRNFAWKSDPKATHYECDLLDESGGSGLHISSNDSEIDWQELKDKMANQNKYLEKSPEAQFHLKKNHKYYFHVQAYDEKGRGLSIGSSRFTLVE